jgi:hypothetical protein
MIFNWCTYKKVEKYNSRAKEKHLIEALYFGITKQGLKD